MDPNNISYWVVIASVGASVGGVVGFLHSLYTEKRDREADLKKLGTFIADMRQQPSRVEDRLAGLEHFKTLAPEEAKSLVDTISRSLDKTVAQAAH